MFYLFLGAGIVGTILLITSLIFEKSFCWLCKNPRTCFFCPTVIFTSIMVLGYAGGIISYTTDISDGKAVFLSVGLAAFSTVITNLVLRRFRKIEDETLMERELIGSRGIVTGSIPAGGYGEVEVDIAGSSYSLTASSNEPLSKGDAVIVETITSPGLVKVVPG